MRSLFGPAKEASPSAPQATVSNPSEEPSSPSSPPPPGPVRDVEAELFQAMDAAALSMIKVLQDDTADLTLRMKVFEKGQDWLTRRKKLQPDQIIDDGEGVALLRRMMADPGEMVAQFAENPAFINALDKLGFVREPQVARPKGGRLNKADEAAANRFKQVKANRQQEVDDADDSRLQRMLAKTGAEDDGDD